VRFFETESSSRALRLLCGLCVKVGFSPKERKEFISNFKLYDY